MIWRMDAPLPPPAILDVILAAEALLARMTRSRDLNRAEWECERTARLHSLTAAGQSGGQSLLLPQSTNAPDRP